MQRGSNEFLHVRVDKGIRAYQTAHGLVQGFVDRFLVFYVFLDGLPLATDSS